MSLAPITLHTGLPGAGKTLNTIALVHEIAEREKAQVYVSGIADLKVPGWIELEDPTKWHTLPVGSICIIDEAQRIFRPRHTSSAVPEHVSKLETIRHQGVRLVVVTQHPKLVDANLRRLAGKHRHYVRVFGSKLVSVHEWDEVRPDPDLARSDSLRSTVPHPEHVYAWYKSAEIHTIKRTIPKRLIAALAIPFLVGGCIWGAVHYIGKLSSADRITKVVPAGQEAPGGANAARTTQPTGNGPAPFLASFEPRVAGLAFTAPAFDELVRPQQAPTPAGCVATAKRCSCYTDQGTRLDAPQAFCEQVVERGMFQYWRAPERHEGDAERKPAAPPESPGSTTPLQANRPPNVVAAS